MESGRKIVVTQPLIAHLEDLVLQKDELLYAYLFRMQEVHGIFQLIEIPSDSEIARRFLEGLLDLLLLRGCLLEKEVVLQENLAFKE